VGNTQTKRLPLPVLGTPAEAAPAAPSAGAVGTVPAVAAESAANATGVRINVITLGCDKNTVDTERTLARLLGAGATLGRGPEDADVLVVNTCGFIDSAKEESVDTLLEAVRMKAEGRVRAVVAMGCLVQRYRDELAAEIPEIDLFIGLTDAGRIVPELRGRGLLPETVPIMERPLRLLTSSTPHTNYLKISEGCDHSCAFCAIPLMRGRHRSTPIDMLVAEARELAAAGVVELNLVSQDTTWYGRDLARGLTAGDGDLSVGRPFTGMAGWNGPVAAPERGATAGRGGLLPELLRALLQDTDIPWFRLFYMYPSGITMELVELMAAEPRLLPYLDMPIQHGVDSMLVRMRRPERRATILDRVARLRAAIPELALRTTVIVGFPGETDEEFEGLLELLEEVRFDRLGAFPYSPEENTRAVELPEHVPEGVKRERLERLMDLQRTITLERNEAQVGSVRTVLVDSVEGRDTEMAGPDGRSAIGRTAGQALEVDGVVHLADAGDAAPGRFVQVRVTGALEDDLLGERVRD